MTPVRPAITMLEAEELAWLLHTLEDDMADVVVDVMLDLSGYRQQRCPHAPSTEAIT